MSPYILQINHKKTGKRVHEKPSDGGSSKQSTKENT
jgi:hypothetical protein